MERLEGWCLQHREYVVFDFLMKKEDQLELMNSTHDCCINGFKHSVLLDFIFPSPCKKGLIIRLGIYRYSNSNISVLSDVLSSCEKKFSLQRKLESMSFPDLKLNSKEERKRESCLENYTSETRLLLCDARSRFKG